MKRIGIFGASECGKTTLAKQLSREYWRQEKRPTLALDPHKGSWGGHSWVTSREKDFWGEFNEETESWTGGAVWKRENCLVIVEEASTTIQRDRQLVPLFTRIRHQHHHLMVIGHDGTDLLPTMRQNLNELFLFLQPPRAVEIWSNDLPSIRGLEAAGELQQYEFLHGKLFTTARRCRLKI
ncbi:MAG TPA: hypothetical protein VK327_02240 [Candidatus Paceibacterota bacterium]|nr:hypothetical protein [Candidatus Paceibacterota bacterium]